MGLWHGQRGAVGLLTVAVTGSSNVHTCFDRARPHKQIAHPHARAALLTERVGRMPQQCRAPVVAAAALEPLR